MELVLQIRRLRLVAGLLLLLLAISSLDVVRMRYWVRLLHRFRARLLLSIWTENARSWIIHTLAWC